MGTEDGGATGLPDFFQLAHVTTSLDQAMDFFRRTLGLTRWLEMRDHSMVTRPGQRARLHVALAYLGPQMIELIEPIGGDDAIYRDALPSKGFVVKHHHMARMFDTDEAFDRAMEDLRGAGIRFPVEATLEDTNGRARVNYADLREQLGYYVENLRFAPEAMEWLATVPRH